MQDYISLLYRLHHYVFSFAKIKSKIFGIVVRAIGHCFNVVKDCCGRQMPTLGELPILAHSQARGNTPNFLVLF